MKRYKLLLYMAAAFLVGSGAGLWLQVMHRFAFIKLIEMRLMIDYLIMKGEFML